MANTSESVVEPILLDTYLAVIKGSIGSNTFRHAFAKVDGSYQDILRDGDLSCAFFVSGVLTMFGLIKELHGTVGGTVKDLEQSGWTKISQPQVGAVIVWEAEIDPDGSSHQHIGFYLGDDQAVSNSSTTKSPAVHHWQFDGKRKVEAIYIHGKLSSS